MPTRRFAVRYSPVHGRGVFAVIRMSVGETILEYRGELSACKEAQRRYERSTQENGHTFFFDLDDGRVIDGTRGGNSARWMNHSCEPNCEAEQQGSRVLFHALLDVEQGQELLSTTDVSLKSVGAPALKKLYRCCCGSRRCRGTMLGLASG